MSKQRTIDQQCVHEWVAMSWQEAYPASDGRKCSKCGVTDLAWLGTKVGQEQRTSKNLVERLRLPAPQDPQIRWEAAAEIERLTAELAASKKLYDLHSVITERDRLAIRVAELLDAVSL